MKRLALIIAMLVVLAQPVAAQSASGTSLRISAAGMKTQGTHLRVISENIANSNSLSTSKEGQPYQHKTTTFRLQRPVNCSENGNARDKKGQCEFVLRYNPNHPAADEKSYVRAPKINTLVETMVMRRARRSYGANLRAIKTSRSIFQKTLRLGD